MKPGRNVAVFLPQLLVDKLVQELARRQMKFRHYKQADLVRDLIEYGLTKDDAGGQNK